MKGRRLSEEELRQREKEARSRQRIQDQAYREQIKAAEERLQAGVQKLHELHRVLLGVKDADSAAASVPLQIF